MDSRGFSHCLRQHTASRHQVKPNAAMQNGCLASFPSNRSSRNDSFHPRKRAHLSRDCKAHSSLRHMEAMAIRVNLQSKVLRSGSGATRARPTGAIAANLHPNLRSTPCSLANPEFLHNHKRCLVRQLPRAQQTSWPSLSIYSRRAHHRPSPSTPLFALRVINPIGPNRLAALMAVEDVGDDAQNSNGQKQAEPENYDYDAETVERVYKFVFCSIPHCFSKSPNADRVVLANANIDPGRKLDCRIIPRG